MSATPAMPPISFPKFILGPKGNFSEFGIEGTNNCGPGWSNGKFGAPADPNGKTTGPIRFNGQTFLPVPAVGSTLAIDFYSTREGLLDASYAALKDSVYGALVMQTRLKPYLDEISLTIGESGIALDLSAMEAANDQWNVADAYPAANEDYRRTRA